MNNTGDRIQSLFISLAQNFRPDIASLSGRQRQMAVADIITFLYSTPLAAAGIIWLITATKASLLQQEWLFMMLLFLLIVLISRLSYFLVIEVRRGEYANADGSLDGIIQWTAVFLFGPTVLWLGVVWAAMNYGWTLRKKYSTGDRWNQARGFTLTIACNTLAYWIALAFYQLWGGVYPINGLSPSDIWPALGAILIQFVMFMLIWSGYLAYTIWTEKLFTDVSSFRLIIWFILIGLGSPHLSYPFAVLAAGLYIQNGLITFLFFITGLLVVAFLARQLSWTAETNRQQSRQLEKLEYLGRDLLTAPPDGSSLPDILKEHIPHMFTSARVAIWITSEGFLLKHPDEWSPVFEPIWYWLSTHQIAQAFTAKDNLPWEKPNTQHSPMVIVPILDVKSKQPIGGIYIVLQGLPIPWDIRWMTNLIPAIQSMAAQVASALYQAKVYSETLAYQKTAQELSLARRIQSSFLPKELPVLYGWQLTAALEPAREIAGDYYDFIPLSQGKLGILIADVADKGLGPALYMALSRTLIRTYAAQYETQPDAVISASNLRILTDARSNLFVTVFYGILDPFSGRMTYCNAGHNPPRLISARDGGTVQTLANTGMPLGIDAEASWKRATVQFEPGDILLLYTDGVTDAQNAQGEFIDRGMLTNVIRDCLGAPAHELQEAILNEVHNFVGQAPQFDDITLVILKREP
jgi:serine phosphatase RsbU (regulator of sigma subunit)